MNKMVNRIALFLSLFASGTTLFCCALPALFVLMGAGSVFASLTSLFPQMIWVAEQKNYLFILASFFLLAAYYFEDRNKKISCIADQEQNCKSTRDWSKVILRISFILYVVGLFFAFILPLFT